MGGGEGVGWSSVSWSKGERGVVEQWVRWEEWLVEVRGVVGRGGQGFDGAGGVSGGGGVLY